MTFAKELEIFASHLKASIKLRIKILPNVKYRRNFWEYSV